MLKSKYFLIVTAVTFLCVAAGLVFNILEMNEYNLFNILIERFSKSNAFFLMLVDCSRGGAVMHGGRLHGTRENGLQCHSAEFPGKLGNESLRRFAELNTIPR